MNYKRTQEKRDTYAGKKTRPVREDISDDYVHTIQLKQNLLCDRGFVFDHLKILIRSTTFFSFPPTKKTNGERSSIAIIAYVVFPQQKDSNTLKLQFLLGLKHVCIELCAS